MRSIELGRDVHRDIEIPHGLERDFGVGHRNGKISPETYQSLGASVPDRLDGLDRVVAFFAWRLEPEYADNSV